MRRRRFLSGVGAASVGGLAGCLGFELQSGDSVRGEPDMVEDRPDAAYMPTHVEGMAVAGTQSSGAYDCALTYTYPHRFWQVTGTHTSMTEVTEGDTVHLMPVVWHRETGIVPPDVNPGFEVSLEGGSVVSRSPWSMLSQRMGFHFGDNVVLPGENTYDVTVSVGEPSAMRTGSLADAGPAEFEFEFTFPRSELETVSYRDIPADEEGTRGAVDPMNMEMVPTTQLVEPDALPGTVRGTAKSGDATLAVTTLDDATPFGGDESETYLAVSARTPYNRYPLPMMSLSGTLVRGGETVFDDSLTTALDADLGTHYGAPVPGVESGDELTLSVDAPPQVARHEGYETAFLSMPAATLTL